MTDAYWPAVAAAALAGLLIGSFLNVCIYRLPRDLSVVAPRSFCPECGAAVVWYDNVPLASFFVLGRKCRGCGHAISWRYPAVEAITAALFAAAVLRYGLSLAALKCAVFEGMMVVLFWTDAEANILPDEFTIGGTAAGLMFAVFVPVSGIAGLLWPHLVPAWQSVANAAGAAVVFTLPLWMLGEIYGRLRKVDALGLGDVKLVACLGVFLGLSGALLAMLIGTISGAIYGVIYVLIKRRDWRSATLPFGSFLCAAAAISALI